MYYKKPLVSMEATQDVADWTDHKLGFGGKTSPKPLAL